MKIKYLIGAGLVSLSLMTTGAQATDWTGIYLGGHAGHSYFSMDGLAPGNSNEPAGISGGLHAGYQLQVGSFVVGIEGSYTALDIDDYGFTNLNDGVSTATPRQGNALSEIDLGDLNLSELDSSSIPAIAEVVDAIPALDLGNLDLSQLTDGTNPALADLAGANPAIDLSDVDLSQLANGTNPALAALAEASPTVDTSSIDLTQPASEIAPAPAKSADSTPTPATGDPDSTEPDQAASQYKAGVTDIFAVAARAGYSFGKVMTYGKIGYATAGIGYRDMLDPTPTTLLNYLERESGLLLGAGAEFAITERISIGVDYTYINFEIDTEIQDLNIARLPSIIEDNFDSDHHQVNVRLNFRFN